MTEATYQSAADCPLGEAHGMASTHGNAKGETCCDFCGFPVDPVTEATPVAMEVWLAAKRDFHAVDFGFNRDQAAAAVIATALKQARHDERLKFVHQPCRHTTKAENETKRPDLHDWQTAQSEWFDATILEIVGEYAAWRDQHTATALADMQRRAEIFRQIGRWEMAWEIAFQLEQPLIDCTEGKPEQASFDTAAKMLSMSIAAKASRAFSDLPLEVQFGEGEWTEVIEAARQALSDKTQEKNDG